MWFYNRERKAERIEQLQAQLQETEESVLTMQAEAAAAKAKLREMELARMSPVQVDALMAVLYLNM